MKEYNETIEYVETTEPDKVAEYINDLQNQLAEKDKELLEKDKELVPLKVTVDTLYDEIRKWESGEYVSSKIGKMFEKSLDEKEKEIRHQVCKEIREKAKDIAYYEADWLVLSLERLEEIMDEIKKGESRKNESNKT